MGNQGKGHDSNKKALFLVIPALCRNLLGMEKYVKRKMDFYLETVYIINFMIIILQRGDLPWELNIYSTGDFGTSPE
jgi:hypothetical protein